MRKCSDAYEAAERLFSDQAERFMGTDEVFFAGGLIAVGYFAGIRVRATVHTNIEEASSEFNSR